VAVVTGIEADHLDYYRVVDEVAEAFADFARRVPPEGVVVAAGDDARARAAAEAAPARAVTFGLDARSRVRAEALETGADGCCRFRLATAAGARIPVALAVPGLHNVQNALAAAAALEALGTAPEAVAAGLGAFRGVARRFEVLGTWGDVTVVDDYAHHPTEVAAALATARAAFPGRRLLCVFQPHQHSRTRLFLDAFARSLLAADAVLLPGIYRSRDAEEEVKRTRAADLAARVRALGGEAESLPGVEDVAAAVGARAAPGDVVLTVGAGDIWRAHDAVRRCLAGGRVPEPGARRPGP
jgi:UDP-N-acetylmuramate--alanine ligase